jgi:beta-N-acetylhexosaminidase
VAVIVAVLLVLLLAAECVLLVWFVKTHLLSKSEDSTEQTELAAEPEATPQEPSDQGDSEAIAPTEETPEVPEDSDESEATDAVEADPIAARAQEILSDMSVWEKVCQMFVVSPETLAASGTVTQAGDQTRTALQDYPVGGVIYFAKNLVTSDQVKTMIANTQSYSKLGLLIAVDEEGGVVNRLMSTLGTTHFDSMYNYRNDGTETAHDNAQTIGSDIAAYGFNTDFAPVADVWSNPSNTVIGYRAYSDDYEQAAELVAAAVSGFHDAGVACTLKHFPGHGDTAEDSHYSSAYVSKTKEELETQEWLPFQAGIDAGADLVMIGHLSVPALDSVPATISHTIVTDILREELGFDGVVITDSLEMSSVSNLYSSDELAVLAIEAGVDLLLEPSSFRTAVNGVIAALDSGRLTEERINESVLRILTLKLKYGIIS